LGVLTRLSIRYYASFPCLLAIIRLGVEVLGLFKIVEGPTPFSETPKKIVFEAKSKKRVLRSREFESKQDEDIQQSRKESDDPPYQSYVEKIKLLKDIHPNAQNIMAVMHECSESTDLADRVISGIAEGIEHLVFSHLEDAALVGQSEVSCNDLI
jgi:hypothetical protein